MIICIKFVSSLSVNRAENQSNGVEFSMRSIKIPGWHEGQNRKWCNRSSFSSGFMILHCTSGTADLVVVFAILSLCFRFLLGNFEAPATDVIGVAFKNGRSYCRKCVMMKWIICAARCDRRDCSLIYKICTCIFQITFIPTLWFRKTFTNIIIFIVIAFIHPCWYNFWCFLSRVSLLCSHFD